MESQFKHIVKGDLEDIIYKKGTHPILKLWNDKKLDTHRMSADDLYKHEDLDKFAPVKIESKLEDFEEVEE